MDNIDLTTARHIGKIAFITIIVLVILLLLLFKSIIIGNYYPLKVQFNFIADLKKGAAVKFIGGLQVGYIKDIYRIEQKVEALLYIDKQFKIRDKAEISIFTTGMMGDKFIEIDQNEYSGNIVTPNSFLKGNDAMSLEILQLNLAKFTEDLLYADMEDSPPKSFQEILNNINNNLREYNEMINKIRPGAKDEISSYKKESEEFIQKFKSTKHIMVTLMSNIKLIQKDDINSIFSGLGDLEKNLNDVNNSLENINDLAHNLTAHTKSITSEKSLLGKLIFSKTYYKEFEKIFKEMEEYSENLADNPNYLLTK